MDRKFRWKGRICSKSSQLIKKKKRRKNIVDNYIRNMG